MPQKWPPDGVRFARRRGASARAGVFATGFCTGSSVIKTVFATTRVPYNVSGSRNLRIVR